MTIYKFKVSLDNDKRTYRHIEILGNQTLEKFHDIIFEAFDRDDPHLYTFLITRIATKNMRTRLQAPECTVFFDDEFDTMKPHIMKFDAKKTNVEDLHLNVKEKMYYLFDFGDSWWHEITLLSISDTKSRNGYPKIVKKVGESPEQYPDWE